jgi:hypothetical protein
MGRDVPLFHLFYSQTAFSRPASRWLHRRGPGEKRCIKYLTEEGERVQISEVVKIDDANAGVEALSALLEDFQSRFPDGEYRGRGIWYSSSETK